MGSYFKLCAALLVVAFASRSLHAEDADALSSKYFDLASDEKNKAEAKKVGNAFIEAAKADADALNEFTWKMMTEDRCSWDLIGRDKVFAREFFIRNADKLLFGSDSGWWSFGGKYKNPLPEFALIDELKLPADVEDKICCENAERLFWGGKPVIATPPDE